MPRGFRSRPPATGSGAGARGLRKTERLAGPVWNWLHASSYLDARRVRRHHRRTRPEGVNRSFGVNLSEGILFERRTFHATFATLD
jgi:hypothetical protein